jgi:NitT/TauT family transport system permease protein
MTALGIVVIILIWKVTSLLVDSENLIPSPEGTFVEFFRVMMTERAFTSVWNTVFRGLTGFGLALLLALVSGFFAGLSERFNAFLRPMVVVFRATPVVAFILLLLIWFHPDLVPIIIAFLTTYPILFTNITQGIKNVDISLQEMAQVYRLTSLQKIYALYLPSIYAFLFSGVATAMGFGWRAIVVGEVLSQPQHGIGSRMREAYAYFNVREVIIWAIAAVLISYFFDFTMRKIEKKVVKWRTV